MNAIDHLLADHVRLRPEIDRLRQAAEQLRTGGADSLPEVVPVLNDIGRWMEESLSLHAAKEDDALFPAVEEVVGAGGPTTPFRSEHIEIHGRGQGLREVLDELERAHPLIDQRGAELREAELDTADSDELRARAEELADLIEEHFDKEEQMLFPMCRQVVSEEVLDEVGRTMESMEAASGTATQGTAVG